jgi:ribosomal protein L31E
MAATRILTINIRRHLVGKPRTKRRGSAVRFIRDRIAHATKLKPEDVSLTPELNNSIVKYYSRMMVPIKVNLNIDNGRVLAAPFSSQKEAPKPQPQAKPEPAKKEAKEQKAQKQAEPKPADQTKQAPAETKK